MVCEELVEYFYIRIGQVEEFKGYLSGIRIEGQNSALILLIQIMLYLDM